MFMSFDYENRLKQIPQHSGVYIMHDEYGNILYVGKAKNLRNRVRQYFYGARTEKTLALVSKIHEVNYILTPTELDALVLENNLIKKHFPPYNILLKDDKTYPYIKINMKSAYPTVEITRKLKPDGARYFGPFMLGLSSKDILNLIHSAFPLRECKTFKSSKRECLNYHIGRCLAPCTGKISKSDYAKIIKDVSDFLSGNSQGISETLTAKMYKAAEDEEFEAAKHYKEMLEVLNKMMRKQTVPFKLELDIDIFSFVTNGLIAAVNLTVVRGGKFLGSASQTVNDTGGEGLSSFIMQYYEKNPVLCGEIVVSSELEFETELESYISEKAGRKVRIFLPKGGKRKELLDISIVNAKDYLQKQAELFLKKEDMTIGAVNQLKDYLGLKKPPYRIECYDISHISGTNTVASMAVFKNGEEAKKHYRHFKIETVKGVDDFASMRETLKRRLMRLKENEADTSFSEMPDLIIIDGGKGQLSSAVQIMEELNIHTDIISLAKMEEEVFMPDKNESILLPKDSFALKLIVRVRDEAHRFAVSYHRKLREKQQTMSLLKKIEGIGDARTKLILEKFKNMDAIRKAEISDFIGIGLNENTAKAVYDYFHTDEIDNTIDSKE